jgi:hypothetical protein
MVCQSLEGNLKLRFINFSCNIPHILASLKHKRTHCLLPLSPMNSKLMTAWYPSLLMTRSPVTWKLHLYAWNFTIKKLCSQTGQRRAHGQPAPWAKYVSLLWKLACQTSVHLLLNSFQNMLTAVYWFKFLITAHLVRQKSRFHIWLCADTVPVSFH